MNRLAQVHKLLKLAQMEMRRLSDELAGKKSSVQNLLQEKNGIAQEIEQAEAQYRRIFQGEITVLQLERVADVGAFIAYSENRKAEIDTRLQGTQREVEALTEQLHWRHGISQNYETLAEQLLREERGRRDRRFENRCDELSLIRWCLHEGR